MLGTRYHLPSVFSTASGDHRLITVTNIILCTASRSQCIPFRIHVGINTGDRTRPSLCYLLSDNDQYTENSRVVGMMVHKTYGGRAPAKRSGTAFSVDAVAPLPFGFDFTSFLQWSMLLLVAWSSVITSVFGRRAFAVLRSTCS